MLSAIIRQFIDTFILVYDKIIPFDAKKGKDGKTRRIGLRIFLVVYVIVLGFSKSISESFYDVYIRISSWVVFIILVIAFIRYKLRQRELKKAEEERKRQELLRAQQAKNKKKKRQRKNSSPTQKERSTSCTTDSEASAPTGANNNPVSYYDDEDDDEDEDMTDIGISDPASSAANSQDSKEAGDSGKGNSPWDDFAIGDALYGLPFNPNKRK